MKKPRRVYVSVPRYHNLDERQRKLKQAIFMIIRKKRLETQEFQVSGLPLQYKYTFDAVREIISRCQGALILDFSRWREPDAPLEGGIGIGLALTKELAQVMGGTLVVESTLGQGAAFTLEGVDDYLTKPFEEEELFARIKNLLTNAHVRKHLKLPFLAEMEKLASEEPVCLLLPEQQEWLANLETATRKHIGDYNLSVDTIAGDLFLSRAQFYRRVHMLTGLTPLQYLMEIRFNHARQLLEQSRVFSVKAASASIGIRKVAYFSAQFRERFGKLPSDYL